uniref:Uncharacterized protein n=1 Tax=Desulfobacca acetoxidans TaxID=60893 RepID=A0A7C3Z957_9BACT
MTFPFEVTFNEVQANLDFFVSKVFSCLESEFLIMPKGPGFIEYPTFESGYENLKMATGNFRSLEPEKIVIAVSRLPISLIVLRCILGFTPSEWAYIASQRTGVEITQGAARSLDRKIRMEPTKLLTLKKGSATEKRLKALVESSCEILAAGVPETPLDKFHRLNKADTAEGLTSLHAFADLGVPYPMLLYERFLGRPFATHRDSVSELVGDSLEVAIEKALTKAGVSFRKTKRAERIPGFDQAPDFIVPTEFNPQVIIEAKLTEDDGTARDKATRIQHLGQLSLAGQPPDKPKFEVVACIAGRGFGGRREDMKKILMATRGKVFTMQNIDRLVECTRLSEFRTLR